MAIIPRAMPAATLEIPQSSPVDNALEITQSSPVQDSQLNKNRSGGANIVFKSTDGGQTWQDISEGLPQNLQNGSESVGFFTNESGLHLSAGNEIFHRNQFP
jgi:hypothetical protein